MTKNGTIEQVIEEVPSKDASAMPLIERQLAEMRQQQEKAQVQIRYWTAQDFAAQGAIQTLEKLLNEIEGAKEKQHG